MKVKDGIISREIQGETVLLNMHTGDYFSLNAVGSDIYNCLSEGMGIDETVNKLTDMYDVDEVVLKKDIQSLISKLQLNNILE